MTPEEKLAKIKAIFDTEHEEKGHRISTHAYWNMAGALIDIERTGRCDAVSLATLKRVHGQLREIRKLLEEE